MVIYKELKIASQSEPFLFFLIALGEAIGISSTHSLSQPQLTIKSCKYV